jgi:hypothetical protein
MSETEESRPFDIGYVLRTTAKHIRKSVNISIRKTFERKAEFENDPVKQAEIFETLAHLHGMLKWLDEYQRTNSAKFKG